MSCGHLWTGTCNSKIMAKQVSVERHWCSELVAIVNVTRRGVAKSVMGNLEEIGGRSALVLTECPLAVGSRVQYRLPAPCSQGATTSYKFHHALGYFLEIELTPASRWSRRWFSPRHLLLRREFQLVLSA
jgi:hypothetical protein